MTTTHIQGLTTEQRETLATEGMVRLPGAIARTDAAAMADALWGKLNSKYGIERERRETWTRERPAQLGPLAKTGAFAAMASPAVRAVIDDLLGPGGWREPPYWGVALVCFPSPGTWDVPHVGWHLDAPASAAEPPIARVFALLERLDAGGGGTVYLKGSHRVVRQLAPKSGTIDSATVKRLLARRSPWIGALIAPGGGDRVRRFMVEGGRVDGTSLQVGEMTGGPGDVYFMHPLTLHSFAPNVRDTPRLMLTQWVYGNGWAA